METQNWKKIIRSVLLFLTFIFVSLTFCSSEIHAQQIDVNKYINQAYAPINIQGLKASNLARELEQKVTEYISSGQSWKQFVFNSSYNAKAYFGDPVEAFYALSLAYPYVSEPVKAQIKAYLLAEISSHNPLQSSYNTYSAKIGRFREYYDVPLNSEIYSYIDSNQGYYEYYTREDKMYALWVYAYLTDDWSFISDNWQGAIRPFIRSWSNISSANPSSTYSSAGSFNLRLASLIGFARMAREVNDQDSVTWATGVITTGVRERLNLIAQKPPAEDPAQFTWYQYTQPTDFVAGSWFGYNIPHLKYLTPEVGRILNDNQPGAVNLYNKFLDTVMPFGSLTWGAGVEGEYASISPANQLEFFGFKAYGMKLKDDALEGYLEYPWSHGDLYYIQKLVAVIQGYGTECWEDLTTSQVECPQGVVLTVAGDVNTDTLVNVLDVQACVNHILGIQDLGSRADVNNDGSVNVLDVQVIVNIILGV